MQTGEIPKVFKTGILTPVHKKGTDSILPTNYRGITVTSALGNVYEYALLDKMIDLNNNQSELQFGFTQGLSPIMKKSTLIKKERTKTSKQQHHISLEEKPIKEDQQTIHLSIIRASKNDLKLNIQEHVSVATRTLYTLISVGLNGQEGLNPITAYKIYQAYVLPRLLYGLEVLSLNATQMSDLEQFHLKTLRCFQSLPIRTSSAAVYMLIGALPIEAELHKRQLSLLYSILASENTKLKNVMERQMTINAGNADSFFSRAQEILNFYNLPSIAEFKEHLPSKIQWKKDTNRSIAEKWTNLLKKQKKWKKNPH
ncbi:Hypothetical predicted protein [Mytilus galloprovincialis]|uniref:Uncharacterized protein n=1 Tax=Mytilus galloprovincialis TaxID=29158 RepID=A0A8B6GX19_MYTGA|nr:Hypothetical predicted protein [Mytilus galloprovincialis]